MRCALFSIIPIFTILMLGGEQCHAHDIDSLKRIISREKNEKKLTEALTDYAYLIYRSQPDSAIILSEKALSFAIKNNDHKEINAAYNVMGLASQVKGTYQLALKYFQQAMLYENFEESKLSRGKLYHNIALTYGFMNNQTEILKYELKALEIFTDIKDSVLMATTYQTLGNYYRDAGEFTTAEEYILKAIAIYEKDKSIRLDISKSNLAGTYVNYGNLLQVSGKLEEAVQQHKKAIKLYAETDDKFNTAIAIENLGDDYIKMKDFQKAILEFRRAKEIFETTNSRTDVGYEYYKIAAALYGQLDYNGAIKMLDTALNIFIETKADAYRQIIYDSYSNVYEATGDSKKALEYYKKYILLRDSLTTTAQQNELLRLKTEFETTQKENEIQILNADKMIKEDEIRRRKLTSNILIGSILIALILGYFLFNRYRLKRKVEQLELRNKIAADLHDDVGSSLSSIKMLSEIAGTNENNKDILEKIIRNSTETVEKMNDIIWMINPKHDQLENIRQRMEKFLYQMCLPKNIQYELKSDFSESLKLTMLQRKDLLMIFKEAVNNAVKYSEAEIIVVGLNQTNHHLELLIKDNGKGFDINNMEAGNGLDNMKMRSEELNAKLVINSKVDQGTEISVLIPV